jgi:hypothetical protein
MTTVQSGLRSSHGCSYSPGKLGAVIRVWPFLNHSAECVSMPSLQGGDFRRTFSDAVLIFAC